MTEREHREYGEALGVVVFGCAVSTVMFFILLSPGDALWATAMLLGISVAAMAFGYFATKTSRNTNP